MHSLIPRVLLTQIVELTSTVPLVVLDPLNSVSFLNPMASRSLSLELPHSEYNDLFVHPRPII